MMGFRIHRLVTIFFLIIVSYSGYGFSENTSYDPLLISGITKIEIVDTLLKDNDRDREIPIRFFLPTARKPAEVVLFSHGLGGSSKMNTFMGEHWAGRGYFTVFLQHPGSDESVYQGLPREKIMRALLEAANLEAFLDRIKDVTFALNELTRLNNTPQGDLAGRMELKYIGMSGHSFGAIITQAVSGQRTASGKAAFTDPRISAAIMFSPSRPRRGSAEVAFGEVSIPWMLMTGTKDVSPIGEAGLESRLVVYPALPAGNKYELVLDGAYHSAFTDRNLPQESDQRNPDHHRVILALSTAFWDAFLKNDPAARAWLNGNGPRSILNEKDRWQRK